MNNNYLINIVDSNLRVDVIIGSVIVKISKLLNFKKKKPKKKIHVKQI